VEKFSKKKLLTKSLQASKTKSNELEFSVIDLSAKNQWESSVVKRELKNLQWYVGQNGKIEKSGIMVEFHDLAFHFLAIRGLDEEALEEVLEYLYRKTVSR